jgi:hypothetical protein
MIPAIYSTSSSYSGFSITGHANLSSSRPPTQPISAPVMRSSPPSPINRIDWPAQAAVPAFSVSMLVDGEAPFDRATLETSGILPATPYSILYLSELSGATPTERGLSLLAEIHRRKKTGEFSADTPTLLFLHSTIRNGELLVGDWHGRLAIPLSVVLHALSKELLEPAHGRPASEPAPVVVSGCGAGAAAEQLQDFPRPILINASEHSLFEGDARAVFGACLKIAERSWRDGRPLLAAQWFERLASVSGDVLHQTGEGEWLTHDPIGSTSSLSSMSRQQARLCMRAKLMQAGVNDVAEALQLFGMAALDLEGASPPLHFLLETDAPELRAKIILLAALGVPIDQRDAHGSTLLHRLCAPELPGAEIEVDPERRVVLARMLLACGADPEARNSAGHTPRALAARNGPPSLQAAFDPARIALDRPATTTANLRNTAMGQQWDHVLSLLDDPQQVLDIDDRSMDAPSGDGESDGESDGATMRWTPETRIGPAEAEREAAEAMVLLGESPGH